MKFLPILSFVTAVSALALFAPTEAHADPVASIGGYVQPQIPLGNFSDVASFGIGLQVGADVMVAPNVAIVGGLGVTKYITKGSGVSLLNVPISGGVRYAFDKLTYGPYVAGGLDINVLHTSVDVDGFGSASDTSAKLGLGVGGGFRLDAFDFGGRLQSLDVGHFGDSVQVGLYAGYHFAQF
jgi:hypothetical protein